MIIMLFPPCIGTLLSPGRPGILFTDGIQDPVNPLTDIIDAASIKFKDCIVQVIKYRQRRYRDRFLRRHTITYRPAS